MECLSGYLPVKSERGQANKKVFCIQEHCYLEIQQTNPSQKISVDCAWFFLSRSAEMSVIVQL